MTTFSSSGYASGCSPWQPNQPREPQGTQPYAGKLDGVCEWFPCSSKRFKWASKRWFRGRPPFDCESECDQIDKPTASGRTFNYHPRHRFPSESSASGNDCSVVARPTGPDRVVGASRKTGMYYCFVFKGRNDPTSHKITRPKRDVRILRLIQYISRHSHVEIELPSSAHLHCNARRVPPELVVLFC